MTSTDLIHVRVRATLALGLTGALSFTACTPQPPLDACPPDHWVGLLPEGGDCDKLQPIQDQGGVWRFSRVFPGRSGVADNAESARYCAVDWQPRVPGNPPPPRPPRTGLEGLARDCRVVAPLAPLQSLRQHPEIGGRLRAVLLEQAGALKDAPVGKPVRVAVVDSAVDDASNPEGKAGKGRYGHGRTIGRVVRELTCPADVAAGDKQGCVGHVANHLALLLDKDGKPDPVNGGYYGKQGDLARAIHRAVDAWLTEAEAGAKIGSRLVLNLSVGWDEDRLYGGPYAQSVAELSGPVRAVHAAITRAVCHGAAVIVAAGNRTGGDDTVSTTGPMYPAAWEQKPAPSPAECRRFGVILDGKNPPRSEYRPLVYAVAGLTGTDDWLLSTRTGGRPMRAGYAFHAAASDPEGAQFTDALTGTSMAAAVTSSAAAVVWGYRPELAAADVMELIYQSGVQIGRAGPIPADFCLGGAACAQPIRRVSVCRALKLACAGGLCSGPVSGCLNDLGAHEGKNPAWDASMLGQAMEAVGATGDPGLVTPASLCPGPGCAPDLSFPNNGAKPFVGPQPGWPGCDYCSFDDGSGYGGYPYAPKGGSPSPRLRCPDCEVIQAPAPRAPVYIPTHAADPSTGSLYYSATPGFQWTSVTLTIEDAGPTRTYDLGLVLPDSATNRNYRIEGFEVMRPIKRAWLSFGTGPKSDTQELIIF